MEERDGGCGNGKVNGTFKKNVSKSDEEVRSDEGSRLSDLGVDTGKKLTPTQIPTKKLLTDQDDNPNEE